MVGGYTNVAFQVAMSYGDVVRVMILFYMLPVWSVIGGRFFLHEPIDARRMLAVVLCLLGAVVILDVYNASWNSIGWVDYLAISSGLGLALTNILFRFTQNVPVMSKVSMVFMGCAVLICIPMFSFSSSLKTSSNDVVYYAVLYGAIWVLLITLGTQWAVTQMEASRSSVILVMELVVAVVSSAIIMNVDLKAYEIVGGFMVMGAALLEGMRSEKN